MKRQTPTTKSIALVLAAVLTLFPFTALWQKVFAADFTDAYMRLSRMKSATAADVLIVFTVPAGNVATEAKVNVDFAVGTTVSGAPVVSVAGLPGGMNALPGSLSASTVGQTVTITGVTNLTANATYGFFLNSTVTNGVAGQYVNTVSTVTAGDAAIDSRQVTTRVIADDQIVITAVVPPTFSISLAANTDAFTTDLDPSNVVSTSGVAVSLATNASNGWLVWIKTASAGLHSAAASHTISSTGDATDNTPATVATGTEQFVMDANLTTDSPTGGTGTVSINGEYNGLTTAQGGTVTTGFNQVASANGPTDNDTVTLVGRAAISGLTPAATDYAETVTVTGAGRF